MSVKTKVGLVSFSIMLGNLARILFALTAIAPIAISLAYIYATRELNQLYAGIAIEFCLGLGLLSVLIVRMACSELERLPIQISKAKSADKEVIGFL